MTALARCTTLVALVLAAVQAVPAHAQWDPANAEWGKSDPADVRVMTWNIRDSICRTENKAVATGNWAAIVRIIAAMEPDVLILQEAGDNSGNGTGSGVDSTANLAQVVGLLFQGGPDPFLGGTVTEYVQLYRPGYNLPHVFVSADTDNFNRNVIVSRWPFADLNGDGRSQTSDFSVTGAASFVPGGDGGIRGFQFAEINLPNTTYAGDLVIGNAHLKSGGTSGDAADRLLASQNTWYYSRYFYNGNGGSTPDPESAISDIPQATSTLNPSTAIIMGGDLNEDELTNGRRGPAEWLSQGPTAGDATTGNDADGSDAMFDTATEFFTGTRLTQGSSKLDYLIWQDSVAQLRRHFIFRSQQVPLASLPPELAGFGFPPNNNGSFTSTTASDHSPVIADFVLPLGTPTLPGSFSLLAPADGGTKVGTLALFNWQPAADTDSYTFTLATDPALTNIVTSQSPLPTPSAIVVGLDRCRTYYWSVDAVNSNGSTTSTPLVASFITIGGGDQNGDGILTPADFSSWVQNFNALSPLADVNADGLITPADFSSWITSFNAGCP